MNFGEIWRNNSGVLHLEMKVLPTEIKKKFCENGFKIELKQINTSLTAESSMSQSVKA